MKRILIKELLIFGIIFFILALGMHYKEWFSHPVEHLLTLPHSQFGPFHPFFFSFGVYIFVLIIRLFIKVVKKAVDKGSKNI